MIDYVCLPEKYHKEGLARAHRLGVDLVFLRSFQKDILNENKSTTRASTLPSSLPFSSGIHILSCTTKEIHMAKRADVPIVVTADNGLRDVLEKCSNVFIIGVEWNSRTDSLHFRSSGLNHVLCSLAKKHSISFLFDMKRYLAAAPKEQAKILGRFKQNIMLYEKFKLQYGCASFAEHPYEIHDTRAFMRAVTKR